MFYFVKTPWLVKQFYPGAIWNFPTAQKIIYLSFDDGPHRQGTPFILDALKKFNARATFFCIGKNVLEEPALYRRILEEGHRVGNHTHNHVNGWKIADKDYFENISLASKYIDSDLFRPPYGRISRFQLKHLMSDPLKFKVTRNTRPGSIVIFHDSTKAFDRMSIALPKVLRYFSERGFAFQSIV